MGVLARCVTFRLLESFPHHLIGRLVGPHPAPTGLPRRAVGGALAEPHLADQFRAHERNALGVGSDG
jgi:hypothetical protein